MPVRSLSIIVATGDAERLHAALTFAAAGAAMGRETRVHLHEGAVALVRDLSAPGDAARVTAGLPTLAQIWSEALELGVAVTLCQSGLALAEVSLDALDPRVGAQGPVSVLADDEAQILTF